MKELNIQRSGAAVISMANGLYVIGGFDGDQIHASVEIFIPAQNTKSY